MADITNYETLEKWLEGRPREVAVAVAARAALRVSPVWMSGFAVSYLLHNNDAVLPLFRVTASSVAAAQAPSDAVNATTAARAAARAADAANAAMATTADRAAADAADAADAAIWNAVSEDCTLLDRTDFTIRDLFHRKLWHDLPEPDWSRQHWETAKAKLDAHPDEGWQVWLSWWQDRRDGTPYNTKAECEIVLLPNSDWEQGPKHVNAIIAGIRKKYTRTSVPATEEGHKSELDEMLDMLASDPLRMAMVDFSYDDMNALMRMAPFPEDMRDLQDETLENNRKDLLSSIHDLAVALADNLTGTAGHNSQDAAIVASDLMLYAKEARKRPDNIRAPFLWMQGATLHDYRTTPEIYTFLPVHARRKLDRIVDAHLDLMRLYYRGALARLDQAGTLLLTEEITLGGLNDIIAQAADAMAAVSDLSGSHVEPEAISTLQNIAQTTHDLLERLEHLQPEEREKSEKSLWTRTKAAAMTTLRLGLRMKTHAADFAELEDYDFNEKIELITSLISK